MFCRFCGQEMPNDSTFCPKCGKKQEEERAMEEKRHSISFDDELEDVGMPESDDVGDDREPIEIWCPVCDEDIEITDRRARRIKCPDCGEEIYLVIDKDDEDEDVDIEECPHCGEEFFVGAKVRTAGKVKCPDCGKWFDLDDDEDDPKAPGMESAYDTDRMMSENGHCNTQICLEGGTRGTLYAIDGQSLSLLTGQLSGGGSEIIIDEPVQSFKLGAARRHIFYTTPKGALYTRWPDGRRQMIAGSNGDAVIDYCLNKDYLFVLLRGGNGSGIIYQLDQQRLEPKIIRSQGRIKSRIGADERYLYYILQSEDVNKNSLVQYDIAAGTEKVIFSGVGIHEISCYRSYVLASTYKSFMSKTSGVELILIDPADMKYRKLADVSADQINCCLDHAFYVDQNTKKLWMAPLIPDAGKPQLVWDRPVAHHEVCMAILHIWGPNDQDPNRIPLVGDGAFQTQAKDQSMSQEEQDSLQYNRILVEAPKFYRDMDLDRALNYVMAEHDFDEEVFDYVAFLTKPQFNKRKEDVNALLAAANYPAQRKPGSEPILFVDTTLFHSRSKGFVVATDGIYTKSKGFMLFDQTFTCEQKGVQNLDACLWRNDRYDDSPKRTLKLDVALSKSKLDEVAGLIELVFAFSYFRKSPREVDNTFPVPPRQPPAYISDQVPSGLETKPAQQAPASAAKTFSTKDYQPNASNNSKSQSPQNSQSPQASQSETEAAKVERLKSEYTAKLDAVWNRHAGEKRQYNIFKGALMFLWALIGAVTFSISQCSFLITIVVTVVAAFVLGEVCLGFENTVEPEEIKGLKEEATKDGVQLNTYTVPGIRGTAFFWTLLLFFFCGCYIVQIVLGFPGW